MQLFAIDEKGKLVFVKEAVREKGYLCPECNAPLYVRSGLWRRPHFYHGRHYSSCRQSGKSETHLQVQLLLLSLLPQGEAAMEKPFKAIHRIADIAWLPQNLVFEIQCSALSVEEKLQRDKDYASLGFQVIWILHDHLYNRRRLSPLEISLEPSPHYFTNLNEKGQGMIYDQGWIAQRGGRVKLTPPFPILPQKPKSLAGERDARWPQCLQKRFLWSLHFEGDLLDRALQSTLSLPQLLKKEKEGRTHFFPKLWEKIGTLYLWGLHKLLKRFCD
jgi:competence protein CoiA